MSVSFFEFGYSLPRYYLNDLIIYIQFFRNACWLAISTYFQGQIRPSKVVKKKNIIQGRWNREALQDHSPQDLFQGLRKVRKSGGWETI